MGRGRATIPRHSSAGRHRRGVCRRGRRNRALTIDANDADEFEVFKTGDRVSVRHPSRWGRRGRNSRIIAHVPAGTDVELSSTSGDVRLVGRLGVVRLHTAIGDIEMGDAARVDVTTASGEFSCGEIDGDATVSSVSGDCTMRRVGGRLDATVTSGDVRIDRCDGEVAIASTSGDVRVGRCAGTDIAVRSISGDVRLGLPTGHSCRGRDLDAQRQGDPARALCRRPTSATGARSGYSSSRSRATSASSAPA